MKDIPKKEQDQVTGGAREGTCIPPSWDQPGGSGTLKPDESAPPDQT